MTRPSNLPALTGLRFFAALAVVLYHRGQPLLADAPQWLRGVAGSGFIGVSFFFVLSGFILAYVYGRKQDIDRPEFWQARFARVYPVYLVGIALTLPSALMGVLNGANPMLFTLEAIIVALFALQAWLPPFALAINPPGWSLSVEAFFYAAFPFIAPRLHGMRSTSLAAGAATLWLTALIPATVFLALGGTGGEGANDPLLNFLKFNPLLRLPEFLIGVLLGMLFLRGRLNSVGQGAALGGIGVMLVVMMASAHVPYLLLHNGLLAPAFAAVIVGLANSAGWLTRLLSNSLLVRLGEASYSLYILHIPVWALMLNVGDLLHLPLLTSPKAFWLYLPSVVLLSLATHQWIEVPARKALRRKRGPKLAAA